LAGELTLNIQIGDDFWGGNTAHQSIDLQSEQVIGNYTAIVTTFA
jgi:hypothetical protein